MTRHCPPILVPPSRFLVLVLVLLFPSWEDAVPQPRGDRGQMILPLFGHSLPHWKGSLRGLYRGSRQLQGSDSEDGPRLPQMSLHDDLLLNGDVTKLSENFPSVDMVFGNGQKLSLSPENYLFRHSKARGSYCLSIFQNGIVVRNTLAMYNREKSKIGFWKTNCSELWERLHLLVAAPTSQSTPESHTPASCLPPSPAPTHPADFNIPDIQIGQITFEMSLSMKLSDLQTHMTELADSIARDLDVNALQVHLLSATEKENDSLIMWAILPVASSIRSNTTAMDIFSRLSEHRMQLPNTFGSYQFIEWQLSLLRHGRGSSP